ncbi:hypothetical protein DL96DRAFT_1461706 [Flagelloscypha sp. PMI_526]|nr:hypothetical protein DL96DRAFT_1461706 [Flagelloscypha sp. PMI_526]
MLNIAPVSLPLDQPDTSADLDDWEDLKELFLKAQEHYDADEYDEALPILRGVIHEAHRFLKAYNDPSSLFAVPETPASSPSTPSAHSWSQDLKHRPKSSEKSKSSSEVPTAFHTLLGTTLLLFGIIIAQEPSLAMPGEIKAPVPYWIAALATFETGDNVPARTQSASSSLEFPTDWRLAVMWGRTLVCLADEILNREHAKDSQSLQLQPDKKIKQYRLDHPAWPSDSIFALINSRRPLSNPIDLATTPPIELLHLSTDLFARGILHMPHQCHRPGSPGSRSRCSPVASTNAVTANSSRKSPPTPSRRHSRTIPFHHLSFSRMREIYHIATSVLIVSEKLSTPAERKTWATQADSLFAQMKVEMLKTSTLFGAGDVEKMRGRCWLVVGSAELEIIEKDLERDGDGMDIDEAVFDSPVAKSARNGLTKAVDFLSKSRSLALEVPTTGAEDVVTVSQTSLQETCGLLGEALLSLANVTKNEEERERLYAQSAEVLGKDLLSDDVNMDGV